MPPPCTGLGPASACPPIICPFLRLVFPPGAPYPVSQRLFVQKCVAHGITERFAWYLLRAVVIKQKGLLAYYWAGEVPDMHALDSVPGVSHRDVWCQREAYMRRRLATQTVDMWTLIDTRCQIARCIGTALSSRSLFNAILTFIAADGDPETGRVRSQNVLDFVFAARPRVSTSACAMDQRTGAVLDLLGAPPKATRSARLAHVVARCHARMATDGHVLLSQPSS